MLKHSLLSMKQMLETPYQPTVWSASHLVFSAAPKKTNQKSILQYTFMALHEHIELENTQTLAD